MMETLTVSCSKWFQMLRVWSGEQLPFPNDLVQGWRGGERI